MIKDGAHDPKFDKVTLPFLKINMEHNNMRKKIIDTTCRVFLRSKWDMGPFYNRHEK